MFWKRKTNKKDGEEPADGDVAEAGADQSDDAATEEKDADTADGADTAADQADAVSDDDASAEADHDEDEAEEEDEDEEDTEDEEAAAEDTAGSDRVELVETSGEFEFEGETYDVTNNTWIVSADDEGVIVIDPAHDAEAILKAVGDREIYLVACTNGYSTHIGAAIEVADRDEADIALHRREVRSWRRVHGVERRPDLEIEPGGSFEVGDLTVEVLGVPGTAPGTVAYHIEGINAVFSGDTLLAGSLGTVGDGYVDYTRQLASVGEVLLSLPPRTRVYPDRGDETTVAAELKNFDDWVAGN